MKPETLAEIQVVEILEAAKFGDIGQPGKSLLMPQSYSELLNQEMRKFRSILIMPFGGGLAGITVSAAVRVLPMEIAGSAAILGFFIGLGLGELASIGIAHGVAKFKSTRPNPFP